VADVFCVGCNERLGWFYHKAADPSQKYKEGRSDSHYDSNFKLMLPCNVSSGKYLLEREKLVKENAWKLGSDGSL
jgi:hypothetical protein